MKYIGNFKCLKCGSTNLGHQQWVESVSPVVIDSEGHAEYKKAIVDTDNELGAVGGYVCGDCKHPLYFWGNPIDSEIELNNYLKLSPEERAEVEVAYEEETEIYIPDEEVLSD